MKNFLGWLISLILYRGKPNPGDIVHGLIQGDELLKIFPELSDKLPMKYQEYREILIEKHGKDIANEVASTPAIGATTIEEHARGMVQVLLKKKGLDDKSWVEFIMKSAGEASNKAYRAYHS